MLKKLVSLVNQFLRRFFSVEVRKVVTNEPTDLSERCNSPLEAYYISYASPHYLEIPLERCRNVRPMAFPCKVGVGNPFVETVDAYMRGECSKYDESPLFDYYDNWCPHNAAILMGFSDNKELSYFSPLSCVLPWIQDNPKDRLQSRMKGAEKENRKNGASISISEGYKEWGPVSKTKGKVEFFRLVKTYHSIRKNGYIDDMGPEITGEVLVREGNWRIFIGPGQHRVAVLTAMGYEEVRICFRNKHRKRKGWPDIIRREEVNYWPHVRSGIYSSDEALAVFDRVFDGEQPPEYLEAVDAYQ